MLNPRLFAILICLFSVLHDPLPVMASRSAIAGAVILAGEAIEGGLIQARTQADSRVVIDGSAVTPGPNGHFVIGFHRDSDLPVQIVIHHANGQVERSTLIPAQRSYDIQRIDGLARNMVTPPEDLLARIRREAAAVRTARQSYQEYEGNMTEGAPDFFKGFDWPATGRISGVYGSQRILNGAPRQPHYGIDIAAARNTPVRAPADGIISMVDDLYFSGWTIMMAHGLGVNSGFLHLERAIVDPGDQVQRGDIIGFVGSTGRSTGPHLDWRVDWQGRRLDASLLAGPMPQ